MSLPALCFYDGAADAAAASFITLFRDVAAERVMRHALPYAICEDVTPEMRHALADFDVDDSAALMTPPFHCRRRLAHAFRYYLLYAVAELFQRCYARWRLRR